MIPNVLSCLARRVAAACTVLPRVKRPDPPCYDHYRMPPTTTDLISCLKISAPSQPEDKPPVNFKYTFDPVWMGNQIAAITEYGIVVTPVHLLSSPVWFADFYYALTTKRNFTQKCCELQERQTQKLLPLSATAVT